MGLFDPKAKESDVRREISRLAGENFVLRQAIVLLIRHSPERDQVLDELTQDTAVLRASVRETQSHPVMGIEMQATLEAIRRMAQTD